MDLRGGDLKGKRALIWERKIVMSYINSMAIHEVIYIILIIEDARNFQIVEDKQKTSSTHNKYNSNFYSTPRCYSHGSNLQKHGQLFLMALVTYN